MRLLTESRQPLVSHQKWLLRHLWSIISVIFLVTLLALFPGSRPAWQFVLLLAVTYLVVVQLLGDLWNHLAPRNANPSESLDCRRDGEAE